MTEYLTMPIEILSLIDEYSDELKLKQMELKKKMNKIIAKSSYIFTFFNKKRCIVTTKSQLKLVSYILMISYYNNNL